MNQKAFKKQLTTISSKDEQWQGFLGATVPNRIDDEKEAKNPDKTEPKQEEKSSKKDKEKKGKDEGKGFSEAAEKVKPSKNDKESKGEKQKDEPASGKPPRRQKNALLEKNEKPKLQKGNTEVLPPSHKNKTASMVHEQFLRSDMEQFQENQRLENEFDSSLEKLEMIGEQERQ